jgi:hypothetical protein
VAGMNNCEPDVVVDFIFEIGLLFIAIINIGEGPAFCISVKFNGEIQGVGGTKLISEMPLFRHLEFMPPDKKITTFLDTSSSYFAHRQPTEIETSISFSDRHGKQYNNKIKHNLDIYRDIGYIKK